MHDGPERRAGSISQRLPSGLGRAIRVHAGDVELEAELAIPAGAVGIVLFAHGSGSSRLSPRNRYVAQELQEGGVATLLVDLLTPEEEALDRTTAEFRFDVHLLANRLIAITETCARQALAVLPKSMVVGFGLARADRYGALALAIGIPLLGLRPNGRDTLPRPEQELDLKKEEAEAVHWSAMINEASEESFPASDAPAWTGTTVG